MHNIHNLPSCFYLLSEIHCIALLKQFLLVLKNDVAAKLDSNHWFSDYYMRHTPGNPQQSF